MVRLAVGVVEPAVVVEYRKAGVLGEEPNPAAAAKVVAGMNRPAGLL